MFRLAACNMWKKHVDRLAHDIQHSMSVIFINIYDRTDVNYQLVSVTWNQTYCAAIVSMTKWSFSSYILQAHCWFVVNESFVDRNYDAILIFCSNENNNHTAHIYTINIFTLFLIHLFIRKFSRKWNDESVLLCNNNIICTEYWLGYNVNSYDEIVII